MIELSCFQSCTENRSQLLRGNSTRKEVKDGKNNEKFEQE